MEFVTKSNLTKYTTYLNSYLKKYYQHLDTNGFQQNPHLTGTTVGTSGNNNYLTASIPPGTTGKKSPNWYYATDGSLQDITTKSVASADKLTNSIKMWGNDFDGSEDFSARQLKFGDEFSYKLIDLGLPSGTLWMDRNLGASSPEDEGLHYAWGELEGYTTEEVGTTRIFDWDHYKFGNGEQSTLSKYNKTDKLLNLELSDDAVNQNIDSCTIPTYTQLEELVDNTTQAVTTRNGIQGWLFTSSINSNSIFIPNTDMRIWSNTLSKFDGEYNYAYAMMVYNGVDTPYIMVTGSYVRSEAATVRGVSTTSKSGSYDTVIGNVLTLPSSTGTLALDNAATQASNGLMSSEDKTSLDNHLVDYSNPHKITKTQIGLDNVDNTADSQKAVLSATKLTTPRFIFGQLFDGTSDISGDTYNLMSINNEEGNTNHFIQFGATDRDYVIWNEYGGVWKFNSGQNGANFLVQLGTTNYFANKIGVGTTSPSESIDTTGNVKAAEYKLIDGSTYAEPCTTDEINSLFK